MKRAKAPLYNTQPVNSKSPHKQYVNVVESDHNSFFGGVAMDDVSRQGMGNDILDFLKPVVSQITANTQTAVTQAGTNLINNQLAKNSALQASSTDAIGATIKAAIMKNKWYIIGGLVLLAGSVVFFTRVSSKKA